MALPRKTSRKIVVDGREYRWTTSQSFVGDNEFCVTLIIEASGPKNPRIYDRPIFPTDFNPPWDGWYKEFQDDSPVLPGQVAKVIQSAVSNGWKPTLQDDFESAILYELMLRDFHPEFADLLRREKNDDANSPLVTHFVSGHLTLTAEEFDEHYRPELDRALANGDSFVVGDARGTDDMAQRYLQGKTDAVVVYHMFTSPRNNAGFETVGGFETDEQRDQAMTAASDHDIAWVRPGREKSGTQQNLDRRIAQAEIVKRALDKLPDSMKQQIAIKQVGDGWNIHRGGMQVFLKQLPDGCVEVRYEAQIHLMATETISQEKLVPYLIAILNRDDLQPVDPMAV